MQLKPYPLWYAVLLILMNMVNESRIFSSFHGEFSLFYLLTFLNVLTRCIRAF
jgi:hypothetical protein